MCKNKDYDKDQKYLDDMVDGFVKDMNTDTKRKDNFFKDDTDNTKKDKK